MSFSADNWGDDLGLEVFPTPTPSSGGASSRAGSSFVSVGSGLSSGESGGVAKRLQLISVGNVALADLCAGFVGSGGKRFCLKSAAGPGGPCTTGSHQTNKFVLTSDSMYLRATQGSGFCYPVFPTTLVDPIKLRTLQAEKRTATEWTTYFEGLSSVKSAELENDSDDDPTKEFNRSTKVRLEFNPSLNLKTPAKPSRDGELIRMWNEDTTPSFSAPVLSRSTWAAQATEWEAAGVPSELITLLLDFQGKFEDLAEVFPAPFRDVEAQFMLVQSDLGKIERITESILKTIGKSVPLLDVDFPNLWCALDFFATTIEDVQVSITNQRDKSKQLQEAYDIMKNEVSALGKPGESAETQAALSFLKARSVEYEQRFNTIRPLLLQLKQVASTIQGIDLESISSRVKALEMSNSTTPTSSIDLRRIVERLNALEVARLASVPSGMAATPGFGGLSATSWLNPGVDPIAPAPSISSFDTGNLGAAIATLEAKVKTLECRVVGDGVTMGSYIFQSFEDCRVWMKTHLPGGRYGFFVDVVSCFEMFASGHVDHSEALAAMNNSQKTGFPSMYEARVAGSMQNLFPTVLGKGNSDGMDSTRFLPALQSPDKWEYNGMSGLKFNIERELLNVTNQLTNAIDVTFANHSEAAGLAKECLYKSRRFITDFVTFVSSDYAYWLGKGYTKLEAWGLVCQSIRRIFEDIHQVRVLGRDVKADDSTLTATQYAWAAFKAHEVMAEYTKMGFDKHPSISAVVSRHLASNHSRTDAGGGAAFTALTAKVTKLETSFTSLTRRFDTLESKVNALQKPNGGRQRPDDKN